MTKDVVVTGHKNPVRCAQHVLTLAGILVDGASFAAVAAWCGDYPDGKTEGFVITPATLYNCLDQLKERGKFYMEHNSTTGLIHAYAGEEPK